MLPNRCRGMFLGLSLRGAWRATLGKASGQSLLLVDQKPVLVQRSACWAFSLRKLKTVLSAQTHQKTSLDTYNVTD